MNSSIIYHQLLDKTYNVSNQIGKTLDSSLNSTGNIYKILITDTKTDFPKPF